MAVKLSSYYWFRNNYLVRSLEDKHCEREFFNGELSPADRKTLKFIVDELDKLKNGSHFQQDRPILAEYLAIPNLVELKDVTSNPELAAAYLQGIHKIMERYWVQAELYRQLGRCFDELDLQPPVDIADAVKYAVDKMRFNQHASLDHMCWSTIKEHEREKEELKKNDPLRYYNLYEYLFR